MRGAAAVTLALVLTPHSLWAHAALLHSSPKAGAVVTAPAQVRLEFSEEVVPDLCHVGLMTPAGAHIDLKVSSDPHDVHAIIAPLSGLAPGAYHVMWHVVSADGHPVSGEFGFTVQGPAAPTPKVVTAAVQHEDSAALEGAQNPFPFGAALARGIGVTALLALAGLLVFAGGHGGGRVEEYVSAEKVLASVAFVAFVAHLALWDRYVLPGGMFATSWEAMLASPPGRLELMRVVASLLTLLLVFARARPEISSSAAFIAVMLTGIIGHPVATSPFLAIPATVIHLAAVSLWLGGILSLIVLRNADPVSFRAHAVLVSQAAFIAFIVVAITGAAQSALLLTAAGDLISTSYGRLLLGKIGGLVVLGAIGAYHRLRVLPRLPGGKQETMILSLRYETAVMACVIILAAFLSYTPLPR